MTLALLTHVKSCLHGLMSQFLAARLIKSVEVTRMALVGYLAKQRWRSFVL
jgi:hypothetical protein